MKFKIKLLTRIICFLGIGVSTPNLYSQSIPGIDTSLIMLKYKIAYQNKEMFIRPCMVSEAYCGFTAIENKASVEVINNSAIYKGLDFKPASIFPTGFIKDAKGIYQAIGTENKIGSLLLVNSDRFLEPNMRWIGIDKAIETIYTGLFFQITNQWQKSFLMAQKVGNFWKQRFKSQMPLSFKEENVEILLFKNQEVRIQLLDGTQAYNLSVDILRRSKCSEGFLPSLILDYSNDSWIEFKTIPSGSEGKFKIDLIYQCVNMAEQKEKWSESIILNFNFDNKIPKNFIPESFLINFVNSQKILTKLR